MDKDSLRAKLKNERGALHKRYLLNRSVILSRRVKRLVKNSSVVASYIPSNNEINPNVYLKKLCFPKVYKNCMYMCYPQYGFIKGYGGIKEPFGRYVKVFKKAINAVIVPGIAFDKRGYRIGYGRGFYDRFLEKFRGVKIGVAFDCCMVEKIENDSHDIAMDFVVSEKKTMVCKIRR